MTTSRCALVVGGYGGLGTAVVERLRADGLTVLASSRTARDGAVLLDPAAPDVGGLPPLDVVVWAHGINVNDGAGDSAALDDLLQVNVLGVSRVLDALVAADRLARGARLCVLSSVWEQVARPGKFSYTVSKAALGGLVRAAALDLAPQGVLVNAVLPGVVDTAMTRSVLTAEQLAAVQGSTGHGRLVAADEVAAVVSWLCSTANSAVTGQSVVVDLGFSVAHAL